MDYAIDHWDNRERTAQEVNRKRSLRHHEFHCPVCGAPVDFRAGSEFRSPYFAHCVGEADENCELYFPGEGTGGGQANGQIRREGAEVALAFEVTASHRGMSTWRLCLALPRAHGSKGKITVPDGERGSVDLYCSKLISAGRSAAVVPKTEQYRLIASHEVELAYSRRIARGTAGLNADFGTVFRADTSRGRRLPNDVPLLWGDDYFVVWPLDLDPQWPRSVRSERLSQVSGFSAARFGMPLTPDSDVSRWAADFLDRAVERPPTHLQVIIPMHVPGDNRETAYCDAGEEVVAAIVADAGAEIPDSFVLIDIRSERGTRSPIRDAKPTTFVSLGVLQAGEYEFSIDKEREELAFVRLVAAPKAPYKPAQTVEFRFKYEADGTSHRIGCPLHSRMLESHLRLVGNSQAQIESIRIPNGVQLRLAIQNPDSSTSDYSVPGKIDQRYSRTIDEAIKLLVDAMGSGRSVEIDGGPFGRTTVSANIEEGVVPKPLRLTSLLRARLVWLLSQSRTLRQARRNRPHDSFASAGRALIARRFAMRFRSDDRVLLQRLCGVESLPAEIEPQFRAFFHELDYLYRLGESRDVAVGLPKRAIG